MHGKVGISGSGLKILAVFFMLTDHIAAVLLSHILAQNGIFYLGDTTFSYMSELTRDGVAGWIYVCYQIMRRIVGRWAFPIYCFLLVEGFGKTKNRRKYAGRLLVFALVSEVPFDLAFAGQVINRNHQNVFFTLLSGFLMIWAMEEIGKRCRTVLAKWTGGAAVFLAAAFLAEWTYCDYGANGIIAIALLFLFRKKKAEQIIAGCIAFLWETMAPLAFLFIFFYNGKRGIRLKYFFYIFYPAHLLVLYLITFAI
ncbi:MAG: conjugal transfer protein TraX [Lachnospiraceae bacterium]|nr:conjugal transfer protein TraX [Lachnospiraceae bacterium]MDE7334541.1 conjugal transfer protein TraX [Lachnospiraceae bacterium]